MDNCDEVRAFPGSRRAKVTLGQAGLVIYGRNRRVPSLRCSEVADLAGVSVEYYAQLERGDLAGMFDSVFDALSRAFSAQAGSPADDALRGSSPAGLPPASQPAPDQA